MLSRRTEKFKKFEVKSEKAVLMQDSYNKCLNILFHGIEEDKDDAWETNENILKKINDFLTTVLKIDLRDINVVDIHRLPQPPLIMKSKKIN